jgi:hypothetical protein
MEQNFYEILEIPGDANEQRIERAYRIARSTYQPASPATYSIFDDADNADILQRIEEAYTVLSDPRLRREYDARLRREANPQPRPPVLPPASVLPAAPSPFAERPLPAGAAPAPLEAEPPAPGPAPSERQAAPSAPRAAPSPPRAAPFAPQTVVVPASVDPRPWRTSEPEESQSLAPEPAVLDEPIASVRIEGESPPAVGSIVWDEDDDEPEPGVSASLALDPIGAGDEPESPDLDLADDAPEPEFVAEADPELEVELEPEPPDALEELAGLEDGVFDGRALRNARLNLGIELDEIAAATKIDERYLRLIEANQFSELPAPVYLRGFLREFAKALRLEPGLVVDSYMKQAEEIRGRR